MSDTGYPVEQPAGQPVRQPVRQPGSPYAAIHTATRRPTSHRPARHAADHAVRNTAEYEAKHAAKQSAENLTVHTGRRTAEYVAESDVAGSAASLTRGNAHRTHGNVQRAHSNARSSHSNTPRTPGNAQRQRAKYLSAHDRKFSLIKAAARLLGTMPASSLTPSLVCRQAGCVRSLFYRYFTDIPDLLEVLTDDLVTAADWEYNEWHDRSTEERVTARATIESVSRLFVSLVEPARPLFQGGNSGIVLDYFDGCQEQIAPHLLDDFVDGIETGHRLPADGLEETWGVFLMGLLIRLVQDGRMDANAVRTLLARAFHIEALLNAW